jgi:hydrogenase-1 operon protein HyaE
MSDPDSPAGDRFEALLRRLENQHHLCRVAGDGVDAFAAGPGDSVLLLTDTPQRCPEAWDLAVVLPEVVRAWAGRLRAGVADPQASAPIAARFGIARFPALLFQRDGHYVGSLEGMYDWAMLVPAVAALLAAPPGRAPGIGIPVRATPPASCH